MTCQQTERIGADTLEQQDAALVAEHREMRVGVLFVQRHRALGEVEALLVGGHLRLLVDQILAALQALERLRRPASAPAAWPPALAEA